MTAPEISVVIASYNRAPFLRRCLAQLRAQTLRSFEVIIADDGSTDGTAAEIEEIARAHPSFALRVLRSETNAGANAARNRGVQAARGTLIALLDSDCLPEPGWLEALAEPFSDPRVAAAVGTTFNVAPKNIYELAYKGTSLLPERRRASRLTAGNLIVRREVLLRFPLDEDVKYGCNEEGLFLRLRSAGLEAVYVPGAIVRHDHPYDRASYFARARILGRATAWLVYKFYLPQRLDLLPFLLAYLSLPFMLLTPKLAAVAALFFTAGAAALIYNELARKRKTVSEMLLCFPVVWVYYQIRLCAYVRELTRLHLFPNGIRRERLEAASR